MLTMICGREPAPDEWQEHEIYLSKTRGNDKNPGTREAPVRTLQGAHDAVPRLIVGYHRYNVVDLDEEEKVLGRK